jgi:ABC-type glycerol-3-phosphate transport system permease component
MGRLNGREGHAMRGEAIAEVVSSLIIATLTGLYTLGIFLLAGYAFFAFHPGMKALALILALLGVMNLPLFVMWCRQTANEFAMWADSVPANAQKPPVAH